MEAGIAFSLMISLILAYYTTKESKYKKYVIIISLVLGVIAAIVSIIIRNIPNFINRTELNFWSMVPIVISVFLILIFMIFEDKINAKIYDNFISASVVVYLVGMCFYYLPYVFNQSNKFVYYGESAVSTIVLFRILGFVFGIIMMIFSGTVFKPLIISTARIFIGIFISIIIGNLSAFLSYELNLYHYFEPFLLL